MKKHVLFFLLMLLSMTVSAQTTAKIDGIYYKLFSETNEAEVSTNSYILFDSGDIVIPSTVVYEDVEYRVTSIGNWAFRGCSGLTSIIIPNSVTSIGGSAFQYYLETSKQP